MRGAEQVIVGMPAYLAAAFCKSSSPRLLSYEKSKLKDNQHTHAYCAPSRPIGPAVARPLQDRRNNQSGLLCYSPTERLPENVDPGDVANAGNRHIPLSGRSAD
jgi:hypothetical protein